MVLLAIPLWSNAQKKAGLGFELNTAFVSESKAFDLKKENNSAAFLQNSISPTLTYDYFLVDNSKMAFSLGVSQSLNINTINTSRLDALARSMTQNQPYSLDWQGGSEKMNFSTQLSLKLWLPAGKRGLWCFEPRGGIRFGGSSGLKINGMDAQTPYLIYEYRNNATQAVWDMRVTYFMAFNKIAVGLSLGYGETGPKGGVTVRIKPPPKYLPNPK